MLTYLYQIDLFNVSTVHVQQPIMRDTYTWIPYLEYLWVVKHVSKVLLLEFTSMYDVVVK